MHEVVIDVELVFGHGGVLGLGEFGVHVLVFVAQPALGLELQVVDGVVRGVVVDDVRETVLEVVVVARVDRRVQDVVAEVVRAADHAVHFLLDHREHAQLFVKIILYHHQFSYH